MKYVELKPGDMLYEPGVDRPAFILISIKRENDKSHAMTWLFPDGIVTTHAWNDTVLPWYYRRVARAT